MKLKKGQLKKVNIIIVGGGSVGFSLAGHLSSIGHHITVIDQNADVCSKINDKMDVFTIHGSGTNPSVLEKADIKNAHMVVAVTPYDDTNLLCCNFARQYKIPKRIARLKSTAYTENDTAISLGDLGVTHVIEPEKEIVGKIMQYIDLPGVSELANFQSDNVFLRGYTITDDMLIANKTLLEVTKLAGEAQLLIVLIVREGISIAPTGSEKILPGDEIITIMPNESIETFRKLINRQESSLSKVIIFGDSLTALHLAEEMELVANRVILVDPDKDHGREAASKLNKTEVLFGDCTDVEMLQELHVENAPFFIAAGKDSEDNIMASLLAKAEGAKEVIAVTENDRHMDLFRSLGIDHIVNPQKITTLKIIENIIKIPIGSMHTLKNIDVEICRFTVGNNCVISGKPLHSITMLSKKSIIIGCVFKNDTVVIPSGNTIIEENDEVLVVCPPKNFDIARKLFK